MGTATGAWVGTGRVLAAGEGAAQKAFAAMCVAAGVDVLLSGGGAG